MIQTFGANEPHGFIPPVLVEEDFIFGAERSLDVKFAGREVLQPDGDWSAYLPAREKQAPLFETSACVPFGTLNAVEMLKRRIVSIEENLSDRFLAKEAGVNPVRGSNPKDVAETLRKKWSTFEAEWPMEGTQSVEEFYADIPQKLKTLAIGRGGEYEFGYEVVSYKNFREALKYSPIGIS